MKIKTNELTEVALDWAVDIAQGATYDPEGWLHRYTYFEGERYSSDWSHGGPIIEREMIDVCTNTYGGWIGTLVTDYENMDVVRGEGDTCLIAAMRCYVASKLGDEVDVPEVLA
jgi:hypothetical protein